MISKIVLVFSIVGLFSGVSAQFLQQGQCDPDITLQAAFDASQFTNQWYEVGRSDNPTQQGDCSTLNIAGTGAAYTFTYEAVTKNISAQQNAVGTLQAGTARFLVNLNNAITEFWVLGTNYQSFAVGYRCENVGATQRNVYIWLLARTTTVDPIFVNTINNILNPVSVTISDLRDIDQSDSACFALPSIPAGQPVIIPGTCDPDISYLTSFDAGRFVGTWHEIYSYYSENAEGSCARAEYSLGDGVVNVLNSQVVNQTLDTITGFASVVPGNNGRLLVSLEIFPGVFVEQDLWVISTDYDNFAITYSCTQVTATTKRVFSWIVSRERQLNTSAEIVNGVVDSILDLNFAYYAETDQSDDGCFYFPTPSPDQVVEFRGPCNMDIPAVPNFDPTRYTGLWHDIESYPSTFVTGTCNNAYYTLVDGVVDVFNTQVIDERLDTINGIAELAAIDGSGKLVVTFPIVGTNFTIQTSYWILATDYESHSLVYTCEYNSATDMRQVFSWKLSRTKALTAPANTAINNAIINIPVLDQRYYIARDQSPAGCFFYPAAVPGQRVVFPGDCSTTIPVVTNFDLNLFQGTWYEIETYPKEESGDCVRHDYSVGTGNVLNLISSFNVEQFPQSSSSVLQFTSTDGSARFNIVINVGNDTQITIPFWILAIDAQYNDYALAYSCVDLNADFRAIYAWKLSRNQQQLSAAGNTAINNAMTNIEVLDNVYFEDVDQSELACTSLPEIPAGQPIILDGQCNPNIAVVQNFDAGRYVGTWHLIESYPSEFQNGDCNDATYTAQPDGSVLVFNTHVIGQTLDTITGSAVVASTDGSAKLSVTFPDAPFPVDYWVIATDYESYALVYSCVNLTNDTQQIWSWKMSRTKSLTPIAVAAIEESMSTIPVINNRYFYTVDNSDAACFYYPLADGNPVMFRGRCNDNIPVVTNFDAVGYMGSWYDIESYPQVFQDGTCSTAEYELRDGGVDVFNTQVVNERLDTISGRALLEDSTDGSAKLVVTFPIVGTNFTIESPYWVLATDYESYALVYACQNIDDDYRSVSSWKLSRQRSLSMAAQVAMNAVIATIDVLQPQYYETKGHTDAQCFYFPEANGEPVLYRGECDENILALPSFDIFEFDGIWNEIETYPKDEAGGQCISHVFSNVGSNTTLLLTSNQVFNSETLVSNNGQIQLVSTDGSGRFELTMYVGANQDPIVIPYWVLATDYSTYALVYSCMNRGDGTRAVYSWKLSRTNTLTAAANTAINAAMSNVQVLEQEYYELVSQSAVSCFYLPETGPTEPAVFPGTCNQTITPIQNFDASQFAGRWFDIESYFDGYEGTCIDGTFTQVGNSYNVVLTQVVNETLDSTSSTAVIAADNSGRLIVTVGGLTFEYWILGTDYSSWALLYSCSQVSTNEQRVRSWKMSRSRTLAAAANTAINNIIADINVLNDRFFNTRDHSEAACFYYPEADGRPVSYRGSCDEDIPVVQDFDVAEYLGQWYDIQSYPQEFQGGQCATAYYSLGDGVVDVYNTQVMNQQLDTINGIAVVASNDSSAKLDVTFNVMGFDLTSPYWVLATDYISYSLVYACTNVGEYKRVSAWKLSRGTTLTPEANAMINNVMSTIPVLQQQYFLDIGQSETDCFYYPDNAGGPVVLEGVCPSASAVDVVTDFNINLFSGTWHEVSRFPSELQNGECASSEYAVNNQNTIGITQNIVLDERLVIATGSGVVATDGRGIVTAVLAGEQFSTVLDVYILDTDYSEFALAYSCRNINNNTKQVYSWKFSRSRDGLSQSANDRISQIVSTNADLFDLYYENTDQSNDGCFHYPEFEQLPDQIELPGHCDNSIQGIPNFDAAGYLGRWFETAKYPQPFQFGECDRAEYSLGDGVVDVFNSHVYNQSLLVQTGTAVVSSPEGRGELLVTFDVGGVIVTANYYILATDYISYALVYSCRNLTNGDSQVSSWKLSRTPTLSNAADQVMAPIIENTRGLREDYYTATSQSAEDCFYVPEPDENNYVVYRGDCGDVTGVPNFDIQRYLGLWHEIERYPRSEDAGQCTNADFSSNGNQFQVVDKSVFDLSASIASSTLTVTADGRLRRTVGQDVSDVWVLATDYDSYALLYSCENINDEYRRVWSAKHSRTRTLTPVSELEIGQFISPHQLLYQRFYQTVDQSDSACFYYPEATGQPVTLAGQCDNNIPVVQNVALEEYTGTWYQIERYPQFHETGDCTGARYTLDEDAGVVTVLNWEVIDGELDTIEGTATPSTTDGSAKFIVELPSREEEGATVMTSLYVLSTDYTTYSLAYSCFNVNEFQRRIGVWKLSRTRTMPAAGTTAINAYMAQREELDQRYFISVAQSEDCEEPSSSFLVKSSIIVILVCGILQLLL